MMSLVAMIGSLQSRLPANKFAHSLRVMETAKSLALQYDADVHKAAIAGLLHDCARALTLEEQLKKADDAGILLDEIQRREKVLIHGPLGAVMAREIYGVEDREILRAVELHTTGDIAMTVLDKVVYLSDYIEPGRKFPGVEDIRAKAAVDLDSAVVLALESTIIHVISQGKLLHPKTIASRNYILLGGESIT